MKAALITAVVALPVVLCAQNPVSLPEVTVYSPRVANQEPVGAFAMPVSALRFEPGVDIQARNLAEGQADITIRGGIFENTGFQLGAVTVADPQTGHYYAELPVAPALLTAPSVATGSALSLGASNANVGEIQYGWRPVRTAGAASVGFGDYALRKGEIYQGYSTEPILRGQRVGLDVAIAHSESDGSIPFGEHKFDRANVRLQRSDATSQTDAFAGYQKKRFGWPNLYTPFNFDETENLETTLFLLNHRTDLGGGDFVELGAYHRRNKDDYAFNRFAPLGPVHPFQHTTWISGAAATARKDLGDVVLNLRGEMSADDLKSTSLTFGRYHTRVLTKLALVPEKTWAAGNGTRTTLKAGVAYEDSNRDHGAFSPVFEVAREFAAADLHRIYFSYTKTTQVPTYTALNSNPASGLFRGNPNLGREKSHNVELGASFAVAEWTTRTAVFWRRDDSLVDWTFRRGVTARTANVVDVDVGGFEIVARRSWKVCDLVLGYTALTKDAGYRSAAVDASFYALNYARHRLTAAVVARLGHGFELRLDNVARVQADNPLRGVGGDEALTTALGLSYRPAALKGFQVAVQADNLWNTNFQEVPAVPAARRQLSAGMSCAW